MIAPRELPTHYVEWNRKWGAPFGSRPYLLISRIPLLRSLVLRFPRVRGYFGIERNNTTRIFEYPWAFHATRIEPGMKAVDIGGGLGGFQFVLNRLGLEVINVDPGGDFAIRESGQQEIARLNRAFGTTVKLHSCKLQEAGLPSNEFDRIFSISVLEHVEEEEIAPLVREAARILKPGGCLVCTVDLFLDVAPFRPQERNRFGHNIDVRAMVEASSLELRSGVPAELRGFPAFSPVAIEARLPELLVGEKYPVLVQALVLQKPF